MSSSQILVKSFSHLSLNLFRLPNTQFWSNLLYITSEFCITVPNSWLKFENGSFKVSESVCMFMCVYIHSWHLNHKDLNCLDPLVCRFFPTVSISVLYDLQLVESTDIEEPCIQRADDELHTDFPLCRGLTPLNPTLFKGQLYMCCRCVVFSTSGWYC